MRIVLFSSYVPFIDGGARFIVEWLKQKLLEYGHEVEHIYVPFSDHPQHLLAQMTAFRTIRRDSATSYPLQPGAAPGNFSGRRRRLPRGSRHFHQLAGCSRAFEKVQ